MADSACVDIFVEVVGRHRVEWCTNELASILAHEPVGHEVEHQRARWTNFRDMNAECETYLYEGIASQDLGPDKRSRDTIAFRTMVEDYFIPNSKNLCENNNPETWFYGTFSILTP